MKNIGAIKLLIRIRNYNYNYLILGAKSVHFERTGIKQADFSASTEDIILLSRGFKHVEISGVVVL